MTCAAPPGGGEGGRGNHPPPAPAPLAAAPTLCPATDGAQQGDWGGGET